MNNKSDTRILIYQINSEDKIVFINEEWIEFAKENWNFEIPHQFQVTFRDRSSEIIVI